MAFESEHERWRSQTYDPAVKRFPERKAEFHTSSGIPLPPVQLPGDPDPDFTEKTGFPGEYPFTRGVQPSMYRGRLWTMRQYAGFATAEESNQRYRYLLEQGQTGLSVAFDLPTQIGYDADDPIAHGEVGKVGVSISSLEDMKTLFAGIPLGKVSTSMTINAPASILLAMYIAVARSQGVETKALRGTIQNDILKEYIARGTYIFPPQPSMRLITDVFRYCQAEVPYWNTISISGYHIREAGSTAVQEVAFTLANAIAYVQAAIQAGLDVDSFAGQLSFFFNAHNNFLEEIAKFRAARRLWARLMRQRFGAKSRSPGCCASTPRPAARPSPPSSPRTTWCAWRCRRCLPCWAAPSRCTPIAWTKPCGCPPRNRCAWRCAPSRSSPTSLGVADTIDPLAGSYLIEQLTDEIECRAEQYLKKIDEMGGVLPAIEHGYIQGEIQDAAYRYQQAVERGEEIVVGMNQFQVDETIELERQKIDPAVEAGQVTRLQAFKARRDAVRASELLTRLESAAQGSDNLLPLFITCVENDLTLGEICNVLRRVWGEYQPPSAF